MIKLSSIKEKINHKLIKSVAYSKYYLAGMKKSKQRFSFNEINIVLNQLSFIDKLELRRNHSEFQIQVFYYQLRLVVFDVVKVARLMIKNDLDRSEAKKNILLNRFHNILSSMLEVDELMNVHEIRNN